MRAILLTLSILGTFTLLARPGDDQRPTPLVDRVIAHQRGVLKKVESLLAEKAVSYEETSSLEADKLGILGKASIKTSWENGLTAKDADTWEGRNYYFSTSLEVVPDFPLIVRAGEHTVSDEKIDAALRIMFDEVQKTVKPQFKPERILIKKFVLTVTPMMHLSGHYAEVLGLRMDVEMKDKAGASRWEGSVSYDHQFKPLRQFKAEIEGQSLNFASPRYELAPNQWRATWYFSGSSGS